ncbi:MAG: FAD-binding oxidoreductase [Steroidobacteraceae bacterium]
MKRRQFVGAGLALAAAWPFRGFTSVLKGVGDLPAKSLTGADILLPGSSVEALAAGLAGDLLLPESAGYEQARHIWNAMFDKRPALIARCTGASDVIQAVNFARGHQLLTAVRGGGHSFSGKSTCDGGIVIDLEPMRGVRVDTKARRAYLETGSRLGQLDRECQAFGLATTAGTVADTGAAGLTLGGGLGRLGRRFGLTCDNLVGADVVTAAGTFVHASESENADLLWGLRGGGGNFGVVTSLEYRLYPVDPMVLAGDIAWPIEQARDVLQYLVEFGEKMPDELSLEAALVWTPDGKPLISVEACWSADHPAGEKALAPLRRLGKPISDSIAAMPYVALQSAADPGLPAGNYYYAKSGFLPKLDEAGIDLILATFLEAPTKFIMFVESYSGAYSRVAVDATAFPNRKEKFFALMVSQWKEKEESDRHLADLRASWKRIEQLTRGFYTNLADPDLSSAVIHENYGPNFPRLAALKAKYDPMNLFRLNANVPPKTG